MDEIIEEIVPKKKEKKKEVKKALFLQRLFAFVIDTFLVAVVVSLITTPFIDTKKEEEITDQSVEIIQKYANQEISLEEYSAQYMTSAFQLAKVTGISSIVSILISVIYFVVYQTRMNGQTLGKKVMKIRVVSTDGDLFYNQMIFRSMIANSILVNLILFICLLFDSSYIYFYSTMIFQSIQYLITFVSVIMVMNKNNGLALHDRIVHTMVVREN